MAGDSTPQDREAEARYRAAAGAVLRRLREERGWSYRDFGEHVGVAHTSLFSIENQSTTPTIHTLASVAAAFDLSLAALLSLIVDEMTGGERPASLANVLTAATDLTDDQRRELLGFIDYLKYRERERTPPPGPLP